MVNEGVNCMEEKIEAGIRDIFGVLQMEYFNPEFKADFLEIISQLTENENIVYIFDTIIKIVTKL